MLKIMLAAVTFVFVLAVLLLTRWPLISAILFAAGGTTISYQIAKKITK